MSWPLAELVSWCVALPPAQRQVLGVMAFHANHDGSCCYPSWDTLQDRTGLSRSTVYRAVKDLKAQCYIEETDRGPMEPVEYTILVDKILDGLHPQTPRKVNAARIRLNARWLSRRDPYGFHN